MGIFFCSRYLKMFAISHISNWLDVVFLIFGLSISASVQTYRSASLLDIREYAFNYHRIRWRVCVATM